MHGKHGARGIILATAALAVTALGRAEVIGPALVNRPNIDTSSGYLFLHDDGTPGFTQTGVVTSWAFYNDNGAAQGGRTLEPVILKQVGSAWVVTGVGQSITTPSAMSGVQTHPFTLAWGSPVVGPDYTFAHHDLANPGSIEAHWPGGNAETHRYVHRGGAKRPLGETIADASFSARGRRYSIQFTSLNLPMTTFGDPLVNRSNNDGANGGVFLLTEPVPGPGRVLEWAFFDNDGASPDRQITPLIFEDVGGSAILRGIGTTRTTTELGEQHVLFGLVAGSDEVFPGTHFFGWKDGSLAADNPGVIDWNDNGSSTDGILFFGTGHAGNVFVGRDFGAGTFYGRDYSVQVTTFIPEPVTLSLLGLGGLALLRRRGRR